MSDANKNERSLINKLEQSQRENEHLMKLLMEKDMLLKNRDQNVQVLDELVKN